jgi:CheY-like chemotaxis protein
MVVTTVGSGAEAIEICDRQDFDIIFMDHMMPEMDGVEAMKRLRLNAVKKKTELCIIALTANAISSAKEMFMSEGFDGFIPKPIEITDLERVLKHVLPKSALVYEQEEIADTSEEDDIQVENTEADYFTVLKEHGVNVDAGLKYCRGDEEFYRQLLMEFANPPEDKLKSVQKHFDAGDWTNYAIRVHAITSTSKMIGAGAVSEMAKSLELAAKSNDIDTVTGGHAAFMDKYGELLHIICEDAGSSADNGGADDDAIEFSPAEDADDVLEFSPVDNADDVLEFAAVNEPDEDDYVLEFTPAYKEGED